MMQPGQNYPREKDAKTKALSVFVCITGTLGSTLDSTAVSIVADIHILVELTNTETAVATEATPPTVKQNFQKATN